MDEFWIAIIFQDQGDPGKFCGLFDSREKAIGEVRSSLGFGSEIEYEDFETHTTLGFNLTKPSKSQEMGQAIKVSLNKHEDIDI